ncbi:3-hydroxyacyl-CoA dehydrogenase family protein [Sphingomonas sp. 1P06PA]|uniref:3-hydroxyacyl-CoA dehydrogenase family protein n=1 Tax=Sphingomonas sp. 1P06PA TaxID=554121 RepID=UPI0039A6906A
MAIAIHDAGDSCSFPDGVPALEGNGLIVIGSGAGASLATIEDRGKAGFVAIELGTECLAEHVGLDPDPQAARIVGFARFRLGDAPPGKLVELVSMPWTDPQAITAAQAAFESAGLIVARCADMPGRIVDRLIRPYFNAVLRRLDDGLASADDMDTTLRLGLGYPEGPNALLARTGLQHHHDVTAALHAALGDPDFIPARRARIAKARARA